MRRDALGVRVRRLDTRRRTYTVISTLAADRRQRAECRRPARRRGAGSRTPSTRFRCAGTTCDVVSRFTGAWRLGGRIACAARRARPETSAEPDVRATDCCARAQSLRENVFPTDVADSVARAFAAACAPQPGEYRVHLLAVSRTQRRKPRSHKRVAETQAADAARCRSDAGRRRQRGDGVPGRLPHSIVNAGAERQLKAADHR